MNQPTPTVMTCTVEDCPAYDPAPTTEAGWTVDPRGRLFCPQHPAETSCRICGAHKGSNRIICSTCINED